MNLPRGTVVLATLDPTVGHEQRGARPCVVVSDAAVASGSRYPMVGVLPVTGTEGEGALYPRLEPGPSGLRKPSFGLVDHVRAVDKRRIRRVFGRVSADELGRIDTGLRLYFGLEPVPGDGSPTWATSGG